MSEFIVAADGSGHRIVKRLASDLSLDALRMKMNALVELENGVRVVK